MSRTSVSVTNERALERPHADVDLAVHRTVDVP
jgi:hypothetical protein